jgi:hypothetical protein
MQVQCLGFPPNQFYCRDTTSPQTASEDDAAVAAHNFFQNLLGLRIRHKLSLVKLGDMELPHTIIIDAN